MSNTQKVLPPPKASEKEVSETPSSRLRKEMKSYFDSLPPDQSDSVKEETKVESSPRSRSRDNRNKSKSTKGDKPENAKTTDEGKQPKKDQMEPSIDRQSSISGNERKRRSVEAELYFKTRICPQFVSSFCERGAKCTYAHGQSQLREPNGRARVCFRFEQGLCKKTSDQCRFQHFAAGLRSSQSRKREQERQPERSRESTQDREVQRKRSTKIEYNSKNEKCDYNRAYEIRNSKNPPLVAPNVSNQKNSTHEDSSDRGFPHENRFSHFFVPQMSGPYGHPSFVPNSSSGYVGSAQPFPIYGQPYYMNYPNYEGQMPPIEYPQAYFDKMNQHKLEYPPFGGKFQHPPVRFDCKQPSKYEALAGDQKNVNNPYPYPYPQQPYNVPYGPPVGFANYPMPYYPPYGYDYPTYGGEKNVGQNSNGSNSLKRGPVHRSFDPRQEAALKNDKPDSLY